MLDSMTIGTQQFTLLQLLFHEYPRAVNDIGDPITLRVWVFVMKLKCSYMTLPSAGRTFSTK